LFVISLFVTPLYSPLKLRGDEGGLFVDKFLVKKSFRHIAFIKHMPLAKVNMPMDDQV
jgi:hypothetical protein